MQVRDGMSSVVLTVGPGTRCARPRRRCPSAAWAPPWSSTPSSRARGSSPSATSSTRSRPARTPATSGWRTTSRPSSPSPSPTWSLERAAEAMVRGGFRHLIVVDGGELTGILSCATSCSCWVQDGATSEMPREVPEQLARLQLGHQLAHHRHVAGTTPDPAPAAARRASVPALYLPQQLRVGSDRGCHAQRGLRAQRAVCHAEPAVELLTVASPRATGPSNQWLASMWLPRWSFVAGPLPSRSCWSSRSTSAACAGTAGGGAGTPGGLLVIGS